MDDDNLIQWPETVIDSTGLWEEGESRIPEGKGRIRGCWETVKNTLPLQVELHDYVPSDTRYSENITLRCCFLRFAKGIKST